jgi:hypothetical protein
MQGDAHPSREELSPTFGDGHLSGITLVDLMLATAKLAEVA